MKNAGLLMLAVVLVAGSAGCGGGGSTSSSETLNVSGTWYRQPATDNTTAKDGYDNAPRNFVITQDGATLTLTATDLSGTTASWSGTLVEDTATGTFTYNGSTSTVTIVFSGGDVGDTCKATLNPAMPDGNGGTVSSITLTKISD